MRILRVLLAFVLVIAGVVSTVGSGGGGGGGLGLDISYPSPNYPSPDFPPNISPVDNTSLDITAANAQDVAAAAVQAHDHALHVAAIIGAQVFPGFSSVPNLLSSNSKFELFDAAATTGEPVTGACAISGMVTVSGDPMNDPVSLSAGDNYIILFAACDDGDGYTIDGSFSLEVLSQDGDPRTDVFALQYGLQGMALTIASGTDSYAASVGTSSFTLGFSSVTFPVIVLEHGLAPLQLATQTDVYSWYNGGYQRLFLDTGLSPVTKLVRTGGSTMKSDFLGGTLDYDTTVSLQATGDQAPVSGEILIYGGPHNGMVRIVIESATSVRLQIDANGDGAVDDYQYTTWAELQGYADVSL
jgi:hypothetical protein